jgi:hypothetical protein
MVRVLFAATSRSGEGGGVWPATVSVTHVASAASSNVRRKDRITIILTAMGDRLPIVI